MTSDPTESKPSLTSADVGERIAALVIDTVITAGLLLAYFYGCGIWLLWGVAGDTPPFDDQAVAVGSLIYLIGFPGLATLVVHSWQLRVSGQTLGKRFVKIRVASRNGARVPLARAIVRTLLADTVALVLVVITVLPKLVILMMMPEAVMRMTQVLIVAWLLGDFLWQLRDRQQRALHDHLAGTYVIRALESD